MAGARRVKGQPPSKPPAGAKARKAARAGATGAMTHEAHGARAGGAKGRPAREAGGRQRRMLVTMVVAVALASAVVALWRAAPGTEGGGRAAGPASAAPGAAPDGWIWNDPDGALARARQEGKPVLVDFWAGWCVWCKKMDEQTYTDPRVKAAMRGYVLLKIDVDKMPAFQKQFRADGLPTTVVLDPSGKEVRRVVGYQAPDEFLSFLVP